MLLSKVIRWFTKAEYSHTWFLFEMYGEKFILQADVGGVQIDPYEKFASRWSKILLVDMPEDFDMKPAWEHLSNNYGYASLLGDMWVYLGRWFKKKWKNPLGSTKTDVCSEVVIQTLQRQAKVFDGINDLDLESASPGDVVAVFRKLGLTMTPA